MEIYIAKSAGFCFGVRRAVNDAVSAIKQYGGTINTYGELIHNPQEVDRLSALGIVNVTTLTMSRSLPTEGLRINRLP